MLPRFADRDILMRYHWGLGVGHIHAHQPVAWSGHDSEDPRDVPSPGREPEEASATYSGNTQTGNDSDGDDTDNPELDLEDRDLEGWEDVESEDSEDGYGVADIAEDI
jgi:hypothetical protein